MSSSKEIRDVPEVKIFKLSVECGQCGKMIHADDAKLLQFTFCGCENKARICLQNRKEVAHLIGAQDEQRTFVHVQVSTIVKLPKMTLHQWNTLQQKFKTEGTLLPKDGSAKPAITSKLDASFS